MKKGLLCWSTPAFGTYYWTLLSRYTNKKVKLPRLTNIKTSICGHYVRKR